MSARVLFQSKRVMYGIAAAACGAVLGLGTSLVRGDDAKAPASIKDVMKADFKGENPLAKKVAAGKGTDADISKLLTDVQALATFDPPKGTKDSWTMKVTAMQTPLEAIQSGDKTAVGKFKTALNCKSCHEAHREKK